MGIKNAEFVDYFASIKIHEKSYLRKVMENGVVDYYYCVQYFGQ